MTPKERMVALIRGEAIDQVPFVQYHNLAGPSEEIWRLLGRDCMGVMTWAHAYRLETPNCRVERKEIQEGNFKGSLNTLITPKGNLTEKMYLVPNLDGAAGYAERMVKTIDDYQAVLAYFNDVQIVEDHSSLNNFKEKLGQDGIPHTSLHTTPFQSLWTGWVPIENLILHLYDTPEVVEEVMTRIGDILIEIAKVTARAAKHTEFYHTVIGDNITAPIIGQKWFRKWAVPYYNQVSDILKEVGIPVVVHMDGELRPLYDDIAGCRIKGLESMSPPPDNDNPPGEVLERCPDKMVWINFPSSVHLSQPDQIYQRTMEMLEEAGHTQRFWIQISENPPVGVWKKSVPQIVKAIRDFGKP